MFRELGSWVFFSVFFFHVFRWPGAVCCRWRFLFLLLFLELFSNFFLLWSFVFFYLPWNIEQISLTLVLVSKFSLSLSLPPMPSPVLFILLKHVNTHKILHCVWIVFCVGLWACALRPTLTRRAFPNKGAGGSGAPQASYDKRRHPNCFQTRPLQAFPKKKHLQIWGQRSVDAITSLHRPQKKHSRSEVKFTPELHRWISKSTARHLQILHLWHQEIFWSPRKGNGNFV